MSEIKGQLLGIILALAVFSIVIVVITGAFQGVAETLDQRMNDIAYTGTSKPSYRASADYNLRY